jgi:hypothetical protein
VVEHGGDAGDELGAVVEDLRGDALVEEGLGFCFWV